MNNNLDFKNYETVSKQVKKQIQCVKEIWEKHLGDELIGVYLHGSMCLNCFKESTNDFEDFWSSISAEIDDYDFNAYNDRYFVSNILILGRILSYKIERVILSKYEGGLWAAKHVPQK